MFRALARRLTGRHHKSPAAVCEACGQVCTSACRAQAIREQTKTQALTYGRYL